MSLVKKPRLREIRRVTNLLLKLKRCEFKMATFRADFGENDAEECRGKSFPQQMLMIIKVVSWIHHKPIKPSSY
jgi:hypothetical protein